MRNHEIFEIRKAYGPHERVYDEISFRQAAVVQGGPGMFFTAKGEQEMKPEEYQEISRNTRGEFASASVTTADLRETRLIDPRFLHSAIGIATESGELMDLFKKWLFYGKSFENESVIEELGDILYYVSMCCDALGVGISDIMEANVAKLAARYPDGFTTDRAENRNIEFENLAMADALYEIRRSRTPENSEVPGRP